MGRQIHIIANQLAKELGLTQHVCQHLVQRLLEEIQDDIVNTGRLEFRGLGTFAVSTKPPRDSIHPATGQPVHIPESKTVVYRSAKALRKRLNS